MRDEGAGNTTERSSKLIVPLRKIHKYQLCKHINIIRSIKILFPKTIRRNHFRSRWKVSVAAVDSSLGDISVNNIQKGGFPIRPAGINTRVTWRAITDSWVLHNLQFVASSQSQLIWNCKKSAQVSSPDEAWLQSQIQVGRGRFQGQPV